MVILPCWTERPTALAELAGGLLGAHSSGKCKRARMGMVYCMIEQCSLQCLKINCVIYILHHACSQVRQDRSRSSSHSPVSLKKKVYYYIIMQMYYYSLLHTSLSSRCASPRCISSFTFHSALISRATLRHLGIICGRCSIRSEKIPL